VRQGADNEDEDGFCCMVPCNPRCRLPVSLLSFPGFLGSLFESGLGSSFGDYVIDGIVWDVESRTGHE